MLLFVCCLCLVTAAQERRRRIKKKIIKSPGEEEVETVSGMAETDMVEARADMLSKPKEPRG